MAQTISEVINRYGIVFEGLGVCEKHGCELWGVKEPVMAAEYDSAGKHVIGHHPYLVRVCPECRGVDSVTRQPQRALSDNGGGTQRPRYILEFRQKKGVDLRKDVVCSYSYDEPQSLEKTQAMMKWLMANVSQELHVKHVNVVKYIEQRKHRFMSEEQKSLFLRLKYEIETADLLIIDSIADYREADIEDFHAMLLSAKDNAAFMILTIPESDYRLDELPIKLRYRLKNAQKIDFCEKKEK